MSTKSERQQIAGCSSNSIATMYHDSNASSTNNEVCVCVGGVNFIIEPDTIDKLESLRLSSILHTQRQQQEQQKEGKMMVHRVDADPEAFLSFLQMARYQTLPVSVFTSQQKCDQLLEQADVWGIRPAVLNTILKAKEDLQNCASAVTVAYNEGESSGKLGRTRGDVIHHNHRTQEQGALSFGSYCTDCDYAEKNTVFLEGEYYSSCNVCGRDIMYQAQLGYCHKCDLCLVCQEVRGSCLGTSNQPEPSSQTIPSLLSALDDKIRTLRDSL